MQFSFLNSSRNQLLFLLILTTVLLFSGLNKTPIYILDEARNAQCAREMLHRNDWIVPTFNNQLRQQKPPLHYYAMMTAYSIFGNTPFGARFFSGICGVLLIVSLYFFVKRFTNELTAFISCLILLSSTHFLFEFRLSVPDPYLILFFTITLFCFYIYMQSQKTFWLILASVAMALAVLSKGPVALGLAGVPILVWTIWEKKTKILFRPQLFLAIIIFITISLPWYILVHLKTDGAFTREFFLEQNLQRFNEPLEGHGGWFVLIPVFVIVGLLPFSSFIFQASKTIKNDFKNGLLKYCLLISIWVVLVFSIASTKLPNYPMLCYPFMAIWLAVWFERLYQNKSKIKSFSWYIIIAINILLGIGVYILLKNDNVFHTFKWWGILFLALATTCVFAFLYFKKKQVLQSFQLFVIGYTVFNFLFLTFAYPAIYQNNPVTTSLSIIKNKKLYAYGMYNPAYNFYVYQPIIDLATANNIKKLWTIYPESIIVARESSLESLHGKLEYTIIHRYRDTFENPVTVLLAKK
jgi:4-amino-4-deoxy-L-arabinose transferase-like glycosyltransferase